MLWSAEHGHDPLTSLISVRAGLCLLQVAPGDTRVLQCRNHFCVPKVLTTSFRSKVVDLPALDFPALQSEPEIKAVCLVRLALTVTLSFCGLRAEVS